MADLIFIGGIGKDNEFGGELSKNKLILKQLRSLGYNVIAIDTYGSHCNPLKIWKLPFIIAAHPQTPVVFSTNYSNIEFMAKLIHRLYPKRKMSFWIVGGKLAEDTRSGRHSINDINIFSVAIAETKSLCRDLQQLGSTNVMYMPNFKDLSASAYLPEKADTLSDGLKCVFMSRISPYKGVDIILDTLAHQSIIGKNITVDIYGEIDADYRTRFLDRISKTANANYKGTLNFFDGSGQQTMAQYHLSLFPTYWKGEGFPGAIIDAFAAGVPVLASDWRFNPEIITPATGFICKAQDAADFNCKLVHIYEHRTTLPTYFDACRQYADNFDVKKLITRQFVDTLL